ncbi:hypothetical protein AC481_01470 [miscellaneous Crenarchaeota group archaeon SMTZ-80]|nr:MAG: hypothetical protein AC481_01470 [miscellaneous Crenarchaeota group archaeon SMTZ-80]
MLKIKYSKFAFFLLSIVIACILFSGKTCPPLHDFLISLGYFSAFLTGMLFAYGFTAVPATAIFLILAKDHNIVLAAFIGGFGSMIGNFFIFRFIRNQFADDFEKLSREKIVVYFDNKIPNLLKKYFMLILAGLIIVSPLPSEIGISLLVSLRTMSLKVFLTISYILNGVGIFIILLIGSLI